MDARADGAGGGAAVSSAMMQASVIAGPKGARVERVARPEPGPGTVRVKLEGCGLCGSNLPVWEGRDWYGPRQVNMWLWNWRGLDVINAHERDPKVYVEGIRLAVDAVASGKLDPFPLITHRFGLDELNRAFEAMRSRPDGFLKAVITL